MIASDVITLPLTMNQLSGKTNRFDMKEDRSSTQSGVSPQNELLCRKQSI